MNSLNRKSCPLSFPASDRSGMALVMTLMVVTIITAMVVEFAYAVYVNTNALHNWELSQRLSLAARSATRLATRLISEKDRLDYTYPGVFEESRQFQFEDTEVTLSIKIYDENSKFNLNTLGHALSTGKDKDPSSSFIRLLDALELKKDLADRISDWIDSDSVPRTAESEDKAKNGNLDSVDELLLIPGVDRETYEKLLPYVTIYGASKNININSAEVPVLLSLSEVLTQDLAERIVKYRENTPFKRLDELKDVPGIDSRTYMSLGGYIGIKGTAFRLTAAAEAAGVRRVVESVVERSGNSWIVRYWKEM